MGVERGCHTSAHHNIPAIESALEHAIAAGLLFHEGYEPAAKWMLKHVQHDANAIWPLRPLKPPRVSPALG